MDKKILLVKKKLFLKITRLNLCLDLMWLLIIELNLAEVTLEPETAIRYPRGKLMLVHFISISKVYGRT